MENEVEEWRPIFSHKEHQVSSWGRVRSLDRWVNYKNGSRHFIRGKLMKLVLGNHGYYQVALKGVTHLVHRLIVEAFIGPLNGNHVDHANGDKRNNLISNLRVCSRSENASNQKKHNDSSSGLKGVCWNDGRRKWMARICCNGKHVSLGYFSYKEDAALAYDASAIKLFGDFALTNARLGLVRC